MRKVLFGLIAPVVLLIGAALVVPSMIDWNSYKGEIASEVEAATGRRLTIAGNLDLAVLPSPRLLVNDVHLASIPGAANPRMMSLKSLRVRVRLAPLLRGRIEVESVSLIDPVIRLEVLADGRVNWDFTPPVGAATGAKAGPARPEGAPPPPGESTADAEAVRLEALRIVNGTVIYRDTANQILERVENLNAEFAARSLAGPFRAKGRLVARGVPLGFEVTLGRIREGAASPLTLAIQFTDADARLDLSGTVAALATQPRMNTKLKAGGPDLGRLIASLAGARAAAALPPWLGQEFNFEARIKGSASEIEFDDLVFRLGDVRATGGIELGFGERIQAKGALKIGRVDLDEWLAMTAKPEPAPSAKARQAAKAKQAAGSGGSVVATPATETGMRLPPNVNASFNLSVAAVKYLGGQIRDVRLDASLNEGEVTLNQASLRLPGEAELFVFGFLTTKGGAPAYDGTIEARAPNLRAVLDWLKIDVSAVPADRLRKFSLTGKLRGDRNQVQLLEAKMRLDTSRIRGGVTYALRRRPAFGASFNLDHLNLDAYLPAAAASRPKPAAAPAADGRTGAPSTPPSTAAAPTARAPLAVLNDFDANLQLRIGSLNYQRTAARGIDFNGTLAGGTLTVRRAAIRDLAGTRASLTGTLTNFDRFPVFRGRFEVGSKDLTGLARIAGLSLPVPAAKLGTLKLTGRADGGADKVSFESKLEVAGAKADLTGEVAGLQRALRFNGTFNASHPRLARLLRTLGLETGPRMGRLGPFGFTAKLGGDLKAVKLDARVRFAGADISANGTVSGLLAVPAIDLVAAVRHPSFAGLMRSLDRSWKAKGRTLGALALAANIKGSETALKLTRLTASLGDMSLEGDGGLALGGARPRLTARLSAGEIFIDPLLGPETPPPPPAAKRSRFGAKGAAIRPAAATAGSKSPAAGGGSGAFSAEPFNLALLGLLDADISLDAKAITYRTFRVDRPAIKLTLADRVLVVSRLDGRLFDGAFALTGRLDGRKSPALSGTVKVTDANVGKALFEAAQFDILGGILGFDMKLSGAGKSPRAMVASLGGAGRISVRNGIAKGFNLRAVSDRLKNLNKPADFLRLFGGAMGGGSTKFSSFDGSFRIRNGVLATNDLKLVADGGEAQAAGTADLPRWLMDFRGDFRLTEHPKAPPFEMTVRGPLDNPKRVFRFEKLQTYLLQRGISSLLRKVLRPRSRQSQPAKTQPPPQTTQPQTQPQQLPKPKDLLRGLLDGLLKR